MAYTFEEKNFKNHLGKEAKRSWFSKNSSNAQYKNSRGTHNLQAYSNRYTVRMWGVIEDPEISDARRSAQTVAAVDATVAAASGFLSAALAPATAGGSLYFFGGSLASGGLGALAGSQINDPRNVYVTLVGDRSRWVAEEVPVNGVRQVAINICEWSNQVWNDRFENYAYQEQPPKKYY